MRNAFSMFWIVDAQSVKNTDSAEQKGYDAGWKVSGQVQSVLVLMLQIGGEKRMYLAGDQWLGAGGGMNAIVHHHAVFTDEWRHKKR